MTLGALESGDKIAKPRRLGRGLFGGQRRKGESVERGAFGHVGLALERQ